MPTLCLEEGFWSGSEFLVLETGDAFTLHLLSIVDHNGYFWII